MEAWYRVIATASVKTLNDTATLSTEAHATLADAPIKITMSGSKTVKLTDNTGASSYIANGNPYSDTGTLFDYVDLAAAWDTAFTGTGADYNGATTTFWVKSAGNVIILTNNGSAPSDASNPSPLLPYIPVTVTVSGGIPTLAFDKVYFAIRTNNTLGVEYVKTAGVHASDGQPIDNTNLETDGVQDVVGDAYYVAATNAIRVCTAAGSGADKGTWVDSGFLHEADDLVLLKTDPASI